MMRDLGSLDASSEDWFLSIPRSPLKTFRSRNRVSVPLRV